MADKRYTFRGKAVPLFRIGGTPVAEYSTAAGDPGRDWRIALYNAEKKGQPDQNQDIHLSAQQKADVESNKDAVQKADVNDVHQQGRDWRIALKNAGK